jgi:hypothetical protein
MIVVIHCDESCRRHSEDFMRADGNCLCSCDSEYWRHPYCARSYSEWAQVYTLHVLCNGRHVKL